MLSLLSGPLSSVVLCILAGIALRYALWYGKEDQPAKDSTQADDLRQRLLELEGQLTAERATGETFRHDYQQLCDEFDRYRQEIASREGQTRTQLAGLPDLQKQIERLENELASQRETSARLQSDLARETESNRNLQDQLAGAVTATDVVAGKQGQLAAQMSAVADQRDATQAELTTLQATLVEKEQQLAELRSLLEEEADACRHRVDEADSQAAHLQSMLDRTRGEQAALESRCQELSNLVQAETKAKTLLGEQLATLTADARFTDDLRQQLSGLQAALTKRAEDVQHLANQRDALGEQLGSTIRRLDEAEGQLSEARGDSNRIRQLLAAKETEVEQVIDQRTTLATELATLRKTHESAIASSMQQLQEARTAGERLRGELDSRRSELSQLATENASLIKEITKLRSQADAASAANQEQLEALKAKSQRRVDAAEKHFASRLATEKAALQATIEQQATELERQRAVLDAERQQLAATAAQELADRQRMLDEELALQSEQVRSETEQRLLELDTELEKMRELLRDAQTEKEEVLHGLHREQDLRVEADTRLAEMLQQMETQRSENESSRARINQLERRLSMLEDELQQSEQRVIARNATLQDLQLENKDLAAELERERHERGALERSLDVHTDTLDKLRADSQALEALLERQAVVQSSLQQHAQLLKPGSDENRAPQPRELPQPPELPAEVVSTAVFSLEKTMGESPGSTRFDPILGPVFSTAPENRDNLKLIAGIDQLLEQQLNRLGVYAYDQIMQWDSRAVLEFSNILAVQGRIERERWVEQARELYHSQRSRRAA